MTVNIASGSSIANIASDINNSHISGISATVQSAGGFDSLVISDHGRSVDRFCRHGDEACALRPNLHRHRRRGSQRHLVYGGNWSGPEHHKTGQLHRCASSVDGDQHRDFRRGRPTRLPGIADQHAEYCVQALPTPSRPTWFRRRTTSWRPITVKRLRICRSTRF